MITDHGDMHGAVSVATEQNIFSESKPTNVKPTRSRYIAARTATDTHIYTKNDYLAPSSCMQARRQGGCRGVHVHPPFLQYYIEIV